MKTFSTMSSQRLDQILDRFPALRIAVLGDFCLDKYLDVDPRLAEVSIETGKTAHQVTGIRHSPGAAGTVVSNLAALDVGTVHAIGFCGDDGEGYDLRQGLQRLGCTTDHLHHTADRATPTYLKPRDTTTPGLEGEQCRYDTKNRTPTSIELQRQILDSLAAVLPMVDAVVVLDQVEEADCGVVTAAVRQALADQSECFPNILFWADSRLRIRQFRGVTLKPNQFELLGLENPPPGAEMALPQLAASAMTLRQSAGAPVCVTRGPQGMLVTDPEPTLVPGIPASGPVDPTGAGDSATAGAVAALAADATLPEAALVGNLVASITVEQLATTGTASRAAVRTRWTDRP